MRPPLPTPRENEHGHKVLDMAGRPKVLQPNTGGLGCGASDLRASSNIHAQQSIPAPFLKHNAIWSVNDPSSSICPSSSYTFVSIQLLILIAILSQGLLSFSPRLPVLSSHVFRPAPLCSFPIFMFRICQLPISLSSSSFELSVPTPGCPQRPASGFQCSVASLPNFAIVQLPSPPPIASQSGIAVSSTCNFHYP